MLRLTLSEAVEIYQPSLYLTEHSFHEAQVYALCSRLSEIVSLLSYMCCFLPGYVRMIIMYHGELLVNYVATVIQRLATCDVS